MNIKFCLSILFITVLCGLSLGAEDTTRLLVKFKNKKSTAELLAIGAKFITTIPKIDVVVFDVPSTYAGQKIKHFKARNDVSFVEPDYYVAHDETPNDPMFVNQWHLNKIKSLDSWNINTGNPNVIIAILDTGVDPTHSDLSLVPGWNVYDNNSDTRDVYGHGTSVAGAAAALGNNFNGITGVTWSCRIMPIRISSLAGGANSSNAAAGLIWAADNGAKVANISYAMSGISSVTEAAKYFTDKGGVVVLSAGNTNTNLTHADNPYVLTVSASDENDNLASFSSYGTPIDVTAPGTSIFTAANGGGYRHASGTSFSAPLTAGLAALILSTNADLSGYQVQDIIRNSSDDLGTPGWDLFFGAGRINAFNALVLALNTTGNPPDTINPTVTITAPLPNTRVDKKVTVTAQANDNVGVVKVELWIDNKLQSTLTNSPWNFNVNTMKWAKGNHTIKCQAFDLAGNKAWSQIVTVIK